MELNFARRPSFSLENFNFSVLHHLTIREFDGILYFWRIQGQWTKAVLDQYESYALVGKKGLRAARRVLRVAEPWLPELESGGSARLLQPAGCLKLCSATMMF